MTDRDTNTNGAVRRIGEPWLVPIREIPVVSPEAQAGQVDDMADFFA